MSIDINWAFGFSKDVKNGVHSLSVKDRNAILMLSSHNGVIYDFEHRKQTLLQGHCNMISCCAVDKTKRWVVTADMGKDAIIIVWDSFTYLPVKTFSSPHINGFVSIDFSDDGAYIATLSALSSEGGLDQEICIWSWSSDEEFPIQRAQVPSGNVFHEVRFSPGSASQLVTTSEQAVHYWDWSGFALESYKGKVSKTDIGFYSGEFTTSIFLPDSDISLTATSQGYIIVWENKKDPNAKPAPNGHTKVTYVKTAVKVVRLLECGVNVMEVTSNKYLVLGCQDGAVRFYDFYLRLEAWFEDLNAGPVASLSFSVQDCPYPYNEAGQPGLRFWVPEFSVGTRKGFVVGVDSASFDEVRKENRRGTLLMQGLSDAVAAISCHPTQAKVALLSRSGAIQVWNYEMKLLMNIREFLNSSKDKDKDTATLLMERPLTASALQPPSSSTALKSSRFARDIAYHPGGLFIAVGFSTGSIKLLSEDTLQDVQSFSPSVDAIEMLKFSISGLFLAAVDENHHVLLFKREVDEMEWAGQVSKKGFLYVGRIRAHTGRIIGIEFGHKENVETLISIGEDRFCVEYDLVNSSMSTGVIPVKSIASDGSSFTSIKVESWTKPTCVMWHPKRPEDVEDKFLVMNAEYKIKEFNADSKQCRKTCLAPRYGAPANKMMLVPPSSGSDGSGGKSSSYVFTTGERILGMSQLPIDGNPNKILGVVAHPLEVTGLAISHDGRFIFTAGGMDLTVNMWSLYLPVDEAMQSNNQQGFVQQSLDQMLGGFAGEGSSGMVGTSAELAPFLDLLEGGPGGELHQNLIDYFYYCQLRHGGEDTIETRRLNGLIPLEEIPALMRAVGFYPNEEEVMHMINEIRYKSFMITGETQDFIGLDEFIRLYVNHRPVIPLERKAIRDALATIAEYHQQHEGGVPWAELQEVLGQNGDKIDKADLQTYLSALLGDTETSIHPYDLIDGPYFASRFLGFEEA